MASGRAPAPLPPSRLSDPQSHRYQRRAWGGRGGVWRQRTARSRAPGSPIPRQGPGKQDSGCAGASRPCGRSQEGPAEEGPGRTIKPGVAEITRLLKPEIKGSLEAASGAARPPRKGEAGLGRGPRAAEPPSDTAAAAPGWGWLGRRRQPSYRPALGAARGGGPRPGAGLCTPGGRGAGGPLSQPGASPAPASARHGKARGHLQAPTCWRAAKNGRGDHRRPPGGGAAPSPVAAPAPPRLRAGSGDSSRPREPAAGALSLAARGPRTCSSAVPPPALARPGPARSPGPASVGWWATSCLPHPPDRAACPGLGLGGGPEAQAPLDPIGPGERAPARPASNGRSGSGAARGADTWAREGRGPNLGGHLGSRLSLGLGGVLQPRASLTFPPGPDPSQRRDPGPGHGPLYAPRRGRKRSSLARTEPRAPPAGGRPCSPGLGLEGAGAGRGVRGSASGPSAPSAPSPLPPPSLQPQARSPRGAGSPSRARSLAPDNREPLRGEGAPLHRLVTAWRPSWAGPQRPGTHTAGQPGLPVTACSLVPGQALGAQSFLHEEGTGRQRLRAAKSVPEQFDDPYPGIKKPEVETRSPRGGEAAKTAPPTIRAARCSPRQRRSLYAMKQKGFVSKAADGARLPAWMRGPLAAGAQGRCCPSTGRRRRRRRRRDVGTRRSSGERWQGRPPPPAATGAASRPPLRANGRPATPPDNSPLRSRACGLSRLAPPAVCGPALLLPRPLGTSASCSALRTLAQAFSRQPPFRRLLLLRSGPGMAASLWPLRGPASCALPVAPAPGSGQKGGPEGPTGYVGHAARIAALPQQGAPPLP
ncbi:collagen alpha-1(I) chain-like [Sarcophilus harrisii]|uniref:collagen alpha-1(I) chain-like n=1 Tax=Sarcophilus harrisii TaxID=9305 RepID=UPI001301AB84|nr:collagen alpha-1(I) chain-like [Sarcophilus harrisii]